MNKTEFAETLADRVTLTIKAALAPVQAQHANLHARLLMMEAQVNELGPLRERVAVTEAKSAVPGPAGPAGKDGVDGFSADELQAIQDPSDDRLITLQFKRGDMTKTIGTLRLQTPRYCGTYEDGKAYVPGDQVTHKGCQWHCHTATSGKPGEGVSGWTLQVKCGRDGKDLR